ncbi:MAG: DUF167 domain-containing protein [Acidimicrobiales bacterium]
MAEPAVSALFDLSRAGVVLRVHVQPGARSEGLVGVHGASLKARVRAPAESGRANAAVLKLLARELGVPLSSLSLRAGEQGRDKRVVVAGLAAGEVEHRLALALQRT